MRRYIMTLAIAAMTAALFSAEAAKSQNSDYQMLPPTFYGTGTSCTQGPGGQNQLLFFGGAINENGQSAINCLNGGITIDPNHDRLGIGTTTPQSTLDVNGEVRAGDTGASCTAANAGAIRFNSVTQGFEGCNGVSWSTLGASVVGVLRGCTSYDWDIQNWQVCSCDPGYSLIEYPTKNSNVAGHNTAQLAFFQCVLTSQAAGAGILKQSY